MDRSYLPNVLDTILRGFVTDIGLTSWKIYGNDADQATVSIRFGNASHNQQSSHHYTAYRKKPPSTRDRDMQRLTQFNTNHMPQGEMSPIQDIDHENSAGFQSSAVMQMRSSTPPVPSLPPQVDGPCDTLPILDTSSPMHHIDCEGEGLTMDNVNNIKDNSNIKQCC